MPILFRCKNCGKKLSITRRKMGKVVTCPECVHRIKVPTPKPVKSKADEVVEEDDEGESDELSIVQNQQAMLSDAQISAEWSTRRNPWLDEEDDDDEDFSLGSVELEESGLDMTPMVDVTFLLLIFFMITASFSMQRSLETTPPEPDDAAAQSLQMEDLEEESVVVEIDAENNLRVDDVAVSGIGQLSSVLQGKINLEGKTELLIEAHPNATHGMVVAVTDVGIGVDMQRIRRVSRGEVE